MADLTGGGAPLLGEPLPIELGNTVYAVRGRPMDGLETSEHLAAWLRDVRPRLALPPSDADLLQVTGDELAIARELREAIRLLSAATVAGRDADPDAVETINRHARLAPRWHELRPGPHPGPGPEAGSGPELRPAPEVGFGPELRPAPEVGFGPELRPAPEVGSGPEPYAEPRAEVRADGPPVAAVLSWIAEEAVLLFAGPSRHRLAACQGPGCVLYLIRETPRREWCSPGCGNRARAARHYAKVRKTSSDQPAGS